jgi:putative ABC transport system permease protein
MSWVDLLQSDLRFGFRTLRSRPAFTIIAALTLGLGIGSASAMFTLVDGILLRPLPYPNADRLVEVLQEYPELGLERWSLSQANVAFYNNRVREFASFAAHARTGATVQMDGPAERLVAEIATPNMFDVLGVKPVLGRAFAPAEGVDGSNDVAILSYGWWQSRFGGSRDVIGKVLDVNGTPTRVIGVTPAGFAFPRPDVQLYLPLALDPTRAHPNFLIGLARLRPGVSASQARRAMTQVMWEWASQQPGLVPPGTDVRATHMQGLVTPLRTAMTGSVVRPLAVLQAAVLVILFIAIANVATLMSSRAAARSSEIGVRTALGATPGRLARQLLTESLALALIGGTLGCAVAAVLVRAFIASGVASLPRLGEVGVNWHVLSFALAMTGVSGVLFGLAPLMGAVRLEVVASLAGTKSSAHRGARRVNNGVVVGQIALSFVLLVSAGLVLESFRKLLHTDLGFDPQRVTTMTMALPPQRYGMNDKKQNVIFTSALIERVRSLPGVAAVGAMFPSIYANDVNTDGFLVEGHAPPSGSSNETQTVQISATPGLFTTLGMHLLYGRDFAWDDKKSSVPVVVVDEALARRYWRGGEAIGKRIRMTGDTTWWTIVGVVQSIRDEDIAKPARPHTFFPYAQSPGSRPTLAVRAAGNGSAALVAVVRKAIAELDASIALDNVGPLSNAISRSLEDRRVTELLLTGFAAAALALAAIGLYGVMALYVAGRRREFGVRAAIGAAPGRLVALVLREGATLSVLGLLIGGAVAMFATRWLRSLLYDVSPNDPIVFAVLAATLLLVALAACGIPAVRAARSDPAAPLRAG